MTLRRLFPFLLLVLLAALFLSVPSASADSSHARIIRLSVVTGDVRFAAKTQGDPLTDSRAGWDAAQMNLPIRQGYVHLSRIPASTGIRQRITLRFGRKAYVPGDHAEPDDAGMARVSRSRRHTKEQRRQQNQKQKGKQSTESHKSPPRGEQSLDGRGGGPVAPGTLPNKDSLAGSGRRQVGLRPHADSRG